MKIYKHNQINDKQYADISIFLKSNKFNNGISFLDNDMNYYEDFPCFFIAYKNTTIIAFMSVFIPDSASLEIYFHLSDEYINSFEKILLDFLGELSPILEEYELYNSYLIFDAVTGQTIDLSFIDNNFSHSECLMQYDTDYSFEINTKKLTSTVEKSQDSVEIKTYYNKTHVGTCIVETSNNYALIHDVEIQASYRGLGYGTETLYYVIDYLKENNYTQILLHVNSANTIAFAMYSHHGFNIIEQIDYYKIILQSN